MKNENQISIDSVSLQQYFKTVSDTDRLPKNDLKPALMGLFGEVGSIMAPAKKLHREKKAYVSYQSAVEEEFGDALWYLAALASRLKIELPSVFSQAVQNEGITTAVAASAIIGAPLVHL